jgi:hypothetical protein
MSMQAESPARAGGKAVLASLGRVRRASLVVLALTVVEYGIGMYVNLYVTVPPADRGHDLGRVLTDGPAVLSLHVVIGLVLALGAVGVLAQAAMARHLGAIAASVAGLAALALADAAGASFTSSGHPADSMAMSVLTGIGLLCYAANLYLVHPKFSARMSGESQV